jgi:hypothetical protein
MFDTRLLVLGAIAAMLLSCGVAVAEPNQSSASYFMPGCRDAASLVNFSVQEFEEEVARMNFCADCTDWRGLFALLPLRLCEQTSRVLQA